MPGELQGFACRLESSTSPEGEDHFPQLWKGDGEDEHKRNGDCSMNTNLPRISDVDAVENARALWPLTDINERECMAKLATEVPSGGLIVEIGSLYGGGTAGLGVGDPPGEKGFLHVFSLRP